MKTELGAVRWQCINDEPFEYAIQQGPHGDEFVKLLDGSCLRRSAASPDVRADTTRFDNLMTGLSDWRNADHEDSISLWRTDVIEILEGVKAIRTLAANSARVESLEAALRVFVGHYASWMDKHPDNVECCVHARHTFGDIRKARAALQQSPPQGETIQSTTEQSASGLRSSFGEGK